MDRWIVKATWPQHEPDYPTVAQIYYFFLFFSLLHSVLFWSLVVAYLLL